jgi:hypothetical protein
MPDLEASGNVAMQASEHGQLPNEKCQLVFRRRRQRISVSLDAVVDSILALTATHERAETTFLGSPILIGTAALQARGILVRMALDVDILLPGAHVAFLRAHTASIAQRDKMSVREYRGGVFALSESEGTNMLHGIEFDLISPTPEGIPLLTAEFLSRTIEPGFVGLPSVSDLFALKLVSLGDRIRMNGPIARFIKYRLDVARIQSRHRRLIDIQRVHDVLLTFSGERASAAKQVLEGMT